MDTRILHVKNEDSTFQKFKPKALCHQLTLYSLLFF